MSKKINKHIQLAGFLLALSGLCICTSAHSEEVINLESTIIGSQEQPQVLYIIPWKQANSLERLHSSLPQTIGNIFQHQEYSELQREIQLLQGDGKADSGQSQ